ncbi:MAG: hypothetical protein ACRERE_31370, partial [Candidatus Entotheonellia bacterium]
MLLLAPSLKPIGGIETAGRVAWEGLERYCASASRTAYLFSYGRHASDRNGLFPVPTVTAESKVSAILQAASRRWPVSGVLVWHLGLLKLLPFFRLRTARIALFLFGIEAWKTLDPVTRWLLRRVSLFLTDSDHTWQRFLRFNPDFSGSPHLTIHLGIGSPVLGSLRSPQEPPAILMVGRLQRSEDYKGHREVIAAWPRVLY